MENANTDNITSSTSNENMTYGNVGNDNMKFDDGFKLGTINGSQILRKKLSDTYIMTAIPPIQITSGDGTDDKNTASINPDDKTAEDLDKMISYLDGMKGGFIGYLSWAYAMLTLFYITEDFSHFEVMLDMIDKCITSVEKYIMTGTYDNNFINYWYGEGFGDSSLKFAEDAVKTASYVHNRASSFESGYSLVISTLLLNLTKNDMGAAEHECSNLRSIVKQLREFSKDEQNRIEADKKAAESAQKEFDKGVSEKVEAVKGNDYDGYHAVETAKA